MKKSFHAREFNMTLLRKVCKTDQQDQTVSVSGGSLHSKIISFYKIPKENALNSGGMLKNESKRKKKSIKNKRKTYNQDYVTSSYTIATLKFMLFQISSFIKFPNQYILF